MSIAAIRRSFAIAYWTPLQNSRWTCSLAANYILVQTPSTAAEKKSNRWGQFIALFGCFGGTVLSVASAEGNQQYKTPTKDEPLLLYQYDTCPWCNKVKAVLDYYNLPYKAVEVNPLFKSEIKFSDYKKVPILLTPDGEQINDSSLILEKLISEFVEPHRKRGWFGMKTAPKESSETAQWRAWADDTLVKLETINVYRSWNEAYQSMSYVNYVSSFSSLEKTMSYLSGGLVMYMVGQRLPKKYGYEGADFRWELCSEVNKFVEAVGKKPFLGGSEPNLADLQVFGVLRAISATETFHYVMNESKILPWWSRMVEVVGETARIQDES